MTHPIRVFQVATGNVGTEMIKRIGQHPDLELIGVHCYSPEKVGRDVGELAGLDPIGVHATGSVAEIIAAKPDVVTFHGVFPDEDLYVELLEAGSVGHEAAAVQVREERGSHVRSHYKPSGSCPGRYRHPPVPRALSA